MLQASANVVQGNFGGPLSNASGQVILDGLICGSPAVSVGLTGGAVITAVNG